MSLAPQSGPSRHAVGSLYILVLCFIQAVILPLARNLCFPFPVSLLSLVCYQLQHPISAWIQHLFCSIKYIHQLASAALVRQSITARSPDFRKERTPNLLFVQTCSTCLTAKANLATSAIYNDFWRVCWSLEAGTSSSAKWHRGQPSERRSCEERARRRWLLHPQCPIRQCATPGRSSCKSDHVWAGMTPSTS